MAGWVEALRQVHNRDDITCLLTHYFCLHILVLPYYQSPSLARRGFFVLIVLTNQTNAI